MAKKSDSTGKSSKSFDVSKPGETPASATSRPVIVGHSPMIKKDPMVRDSIADSENPKDEEESKLPIQTHEIKIEPLKEESKPKEEAKAEEKTEEKPADKKPKPEEEKPEESKSESGAVEALAGEVTAKREEQKQKEAAEAKVKEVEKVIESKEFFLPIGQAARRRSAFRFVLVFIVFILVAAIILNFMIDAEALDIGVEPLTDLL
jgi:FtsZ-interacting cell division protein ZipA